MTGPLSEDLNYCYSLMFMAEKNLEKGCFVKALLCYENCRKVAGNELNNSEIYTHSYLRAARKEAQILMKLNLNRKALGLLEKTLNEVAKDFHSMDKLLVLSQILDLSKTFAIDKVKAYEEMMEIESRNLD